MADTLLIEDATRLLTETGCDALLLESAEVAGCTITAALTGSGALTATILLSVPQGEDAVLNLVLHNTTTPSLTGVFGAPVTVVDAVVPLMEAIPE